MTFSWRSMKCRPNNSVKRVLSMRILADQSKRSKVHSSSNRHPATGWPGVGDRGSPLRRREPTRFHSVDDDAPGTTTKKRQGAFEAIDDRGQILLENGDHAAEPAVAERHDKAVHHPRSAATEFLQQAEPAEIHFCHFAGEALGPSHGDRGGRAKLAPLPRKSIQGAIGDHQPLTA